MSSPSIKLYRLRGIFVVYFMLKTIAGLVISWSLIQLAAPDHTDHIINGEVNVNFNRFEPGTLIAFSLIIAAVILVIALLIFGQLLQRKNWARVLLLVIGWLTVISAVFSLLMTTPSSRFAAYISQWLPDMDWEKLMQFDRIQKIFELLFWGYLISVLQFDHAMRDEFFPRVPEGDAPTQEKQP